MVKNIKNQNRSVADRPQEKSIGDKDRSPPKGKSMAAGDKGRCPKQISVGDKRQSPKEKSVAKYMACSSDDESQSKELTSDDEPNYSSEENTVDSAGNIYNYCNYLFF